MAEKIIPLENKRQLNQTKKTALERRRKIIAVRKVFHCTHCASKCEKCGTQIVADQGQKETIPGKRLIPYRFCSSCKEEYIDYIDKLQGKGKKDNYWHNHSWMTIWKTWIEYQNSIDQYLKSKEFVQLLEELRDDQA